MLHEDCWAPSDRVVFVHTKVMYIVIHNCVVCTVIDSLIWIRFDMWLHNSQWLKQQVLKWVQYSWKIEDNKPEPCVLFDFNMTLEPRKRVLGFWGTLLLTQFADAVWCTPVSSNFISLLKHLFPALRNLLLQQLSCHEVGMCPHNPGEIQLVLVSLGCLNGFINCLKQSSFG